MNMSRRGPHAAHEPRHWQPRRPVLLARALIAAGWLAGVGALLLVAGCSKRAPSAQSSSPPEVAKALVQRLEQNEPQALWEAMPPSYQADLQTLLGDFCAHMDPEVYDRLFRILGKGVRVMKEKREYFFKSPVALSTPLIETMSGERWNTTISLLQTVATSDIASLESLRRVNPGRFLETTGQQVMAALDQMRQQFARSPGPNPWRKLAEAMDSARTEFQPSGQDRGWLRFGGTTNASLKDVELVRVEGMWVPQPASAVWKERVAKAREGFAKLDGPEFKKIKPMLTLVMATLETSMDSLLKATTQKEFDETLKGLSAVGALMASMRPKPQQPPQ